MKIGTCVFSYFLEHVLLFLDDNMAENAKECLATRHLVVFLPTSTWCCL